ncbi:MAG: phage holin family protein [Arenimonas sp.]
MENIHLSEPFPGSGPDSTDQDSPRRSIDPLNAIRLLRSAGSALCEQAGLYGQLARVEWAEEKKRLLKMLAATLAGMIFLLCTLLFVGVLVLALSWDTAYRIHAVVVMLAVYGIGIAIAWQKLKALSALGEKSFAATREEFAADMALIKSKL